MFPSNQSNILCYVSTHTQFQFLHTYPASSSSFSVSQFFFSCLLQILVFIFPLRISFSKFVSYFFLLLLSVLVSSVLSSVSFPPKNSRLSLSTKLLQYSTIFKLQYLFHLNCTPCSPQYIHISYLQGVNHTIFLCHSLLIVPVDIIALAISVTTLSVASFWRDIFI